MTASCRHALACASSRLERVDVLDVDDDGTTRVFHAPLLGERHSIVEGRARVVDLGRTDEAIPVQRLAIDHRDGNLRSRLNIGQRLPTGVLVEYQRPIIADTQGTFRPILGVVPSVTVARIASCAPSIRFISSVRVDIVCETS